MQAYKNVLVPFPGFLYLYNNMSKLEMKRIGSRPLPGVLISLLVNFMSPKLKRKFSSPSRGSYISTIELYTLAILQFSSPSRGSYISTLSSQSLELYTHISAFAAQM